MEGAKTFTFSQSLCLNQMMKFTRLSTISAIVFLASGCLSKQKGSAQVSATPQKIEVESANRPDLSPKLYESLASSGVKADKKDHAEVITAFNVYCKATLPDGNRVCTFENKNRKFRVGKQDSEDLADLLFGLDLAQGDSGVAASFIECSKFGKDQVSYSCDVAIPIDYKKP